VRFFDPDAALSSEPSHTSALWTLLSSASGAGRLDMVLCADVSFGGSYDVYVCSLPVIAWPSDSYNGNDGLDSGSSITEAGILGGDMFLQTEVVWETERKESQLTGRPRTSLYSLEVPAFCACA
jgi:hypothetical protein